MTRYIGVANRGSGRPEHEAGPTRKSQTEGTGYHAGGFRILVGNAHNGTHIRGAQGPINHRRVRGQRKPGAGYVSRFQERMERGNVDSVPRPSRHGAGTQASVHRYHTRENTLVEDQYGTTTQEGTRGHPNPNSIPGGRLCPTPDQYHRILHLPCQAQKGQALVQPNVPSGTENSAASTNLGGARATRRADRPYLQEDMQGHL